MSTILATEGIYSDHNHSCLHSPSSQQIPGTQGTVWEYKWTGNHAPRCGVCCYWGLYQSQLQNNSSKILPTHQHQHMWCSCTRPLLLCFPGRLQIPPPPDLSANRINSSVLLLPAYRQKLKREAPALRTIHCRIGPIRRYTTGLFWSRGLGHSSGQRLMMT